MAKLSHKLTLNQMQLLAYAIYSAQQDGKTKFNKHEFEKKFNLGEYRREEAKEDSRRLFELGFSLDDLETGEFDFLHVFQRINYKDGLFTFKWSEDIVPHILDLKDRYVTNGFLTIANFKSGFSWILYDYLKGLYGHWRKYLSKDALMSLFCVEDKKTYQKNTGRFKQAVLDLAIKEINEYTEIEIRYKEKKEGRSIVGFDLQWSAGEKVPSATKKQIQELKTITDAIADDMFKYINLSNPNRQKQAIDLVRKTETMRIHIKEQPICITKMRAEKLIQDVNESMLLLEKLYEADQNKDEERDTSWQRVSRRWATSPFLDGHINCLLGLPSSGVSPIFYFPLESPYIQDAWLKWKNKIFKIHHFFGDPIVVWYAAEFVIIYNVRSKYTYLQFSVPGVV